MTIRSTLILTTTLTVFGAAAVVGDQSGITKIELDRIELVANPDLEGVSSAFLQGAFDAPGLYAAHARMEPGAVFPPHSHPDVRLTLVTSGTMYLGEGATIDEARLVAYPAGTVAVTRPGVLHYMVARDEAATMLEIGSGPSGSAPPPE